MGSVSATTAADAWRSVFVSLFFPYFDLFRLVFVASSLLSDLFHGVLVFFCYRRWNCMLLVGVRKVTCCSGRNFMVGVDPTQLPPGAHFAEVSCCAITLSEHVMRSCDGFVFTRVVPQKPQMSLVAFSS